MTASNETFTVGTRQKGCAGEWALPDIAVNGQNTVSLTTLEGDVPADAVMVEITGRIQLNATGVADTDLTGTAESYADAPGGSQNSVDWKQARINEAAGRTPGEIITEIPFRLDCYVVAHTSPPDININFNDGPGNNSKLVGLRVKSVWLP